MSRLQKIIFTGFVILSIILGYLGYRSLKNVKQPSVRAFTLIPDSCSLLLTFENYTDFSNSLRNKSLIWQDLRLVSRFKQLDKHLTYFDSLLTTNEELAELTDNNPVYFSTYPTNKFLITLNLKELSDEKVFRDKVATLFKDPSIPLTTELNDGVLGVSNDPRLLQKLFNSSSAKLSANKNFSILRDAANYQGTSIYINSEGLLNKIFSSVSIKPESIAFNGIGVPDSASFNGDISAAPLSSYAFLENIPMLCNAFEVYSINNAEKSFASHTEKDWWIPVNESALFNAKKQFYENISEYVITVSLPSKNKALLLHIKDSLKFGELLPFMKDTNAITGAIVELQKNKGSFGKSTFPALELPKLEYAAVFNDHLVFTQTKEDAAIFINAMLNNSSILQNADFKNYASKNFNLDFHSLKYCLVNSLNKTQVPFGKRLNEEDLINLKNISHCSFLSTYKSGFINYRFHVKYFQENIIDEPNVLWTMNSDSTIITRPFLFKNHITGGNEVVFQMQNNTLCLQNATGKLAWKKHLTEIIRSDIYTVDAFKNGKYQLLFNTDNYIHLLDRNGNYVQGYPVKLPSKATNKLCVFDYENKNDLRLFIACIDRKIYNYTIWGIKNEGYKPLVTDNDVILPVKYCKVGLSDYLVTADRKGKIYAFSRKGEGRIDFKNKLVEDVTDFELEEGNSLSNTQVIYYDEKNSLIDKISLTDKKEIFKTQESESKWAYSFGDFDKNKITDVLLSTQGKLGVYDITGNKIFSREEPGLKVPYSLDYKSLGNISYISILDSVNSKLIVINEQQIKEFSATQLPLPCTLFNDGKPYLLVVSGKQIKCYKL